MRDAELELEAELEDLMARLDESDLEAEAEMFSPAATGPIFDVACAGCAAGQCVACPDGQCAPCPAHDGRCRALLFQAVVEGIKLARNAADKIDAAISVPPASRNPAAKETARLFRAFFCHDPSFFISWAGGPSGASIAVRFRAVADELNGGRRIQFICRPARVLCGAADETCCDHADNAFTMATLAGRESTIFLCPPFWTEQHLPGLPDEDRRGGTIVHEMLHMLFGHGPESGQHGIHGILDSDPKRANAHCYKAFLLRVNGFGQDPVASGGCGPC